MKWLALILLLPSLSFANGLQLFAGNTLRHGQTEAIELNYQANTNFLHGSTLEQSITYVGSSNFKGSQPNKIIITSRVIKNFNRIYLGFGIAYSETDRYNGSQFNFNDIIGINLTSRASVRYSHYSNAGLCKGSNTGRDFLLLGYKF